MFSHEPQRQPVQPLGIGSPTAVKGTLKGSVDPDFIDGLACTDTLTGLAGADRFGIGFSHSSITTPDRITDFALGRGKIMFLSGTGSPLPLPTSFSSAADNSAAARLQQLASSVFTDAYGVLLGNQPLAAKAAALVRATHPAISGTLAAMSTIAANRVFV